MILEELSGSFTVCKLADGSIVNWSDEFVFFAKTDAEWSLVCLTGRVPHNALARSDGWRAIRVGGTLDFALIGILSGITSALAAAGVGVFAVSTYDTDYIFVRAEQLDRARIALIGAGHTFA